jgi:hypothetical protein
MRDMVKLPRRRVAGCLKGYSWGRLGSVGGVWYGGVSQKSFPSAFSEVMFPLFRPYWLPRQIGPQDNGFAPRLQLKSCLKVPVA